MAIDTFIISFVFLSFLHKICTLLRSDNRVIRDEFQGIVSILIIYASILKSSVEEDAFIWSSLAAEFTDWFDMTLIVLTRP